MEAWIPLFDIFLNSPTPESEASLWFQHSFNGTNVTSTNSFLSLLSKPVDVVLVDSSASSATHSSSSHSKSRVMYIQTLPNAVQSRILSFLMVESRRFCAGDLSKLANSILKGENEVDFWVKKAAHNLFDAVSSSGLNWISSLSLSSSEEIIEEKFDALPSWLESSTSNSISSVLPWLPLSYDELKSSTFNEESSDEDSMVEIEEEKMETDEDLNQMDVDMETAHRVDATIASEIQKEAAILKAQLVNFESASKTLGLANAVLQLCFNEAGGEGGISLVILGLIEPWEADDENASILISNLLGGREEDSSWPSKILCSVILPKLLVLSKPASRVLVTATIEFCKLHPKAAVDALLFPLIFRNEGMNTPICDVVTRIIRECLHIAHAAAFCQKVLCGDKEQRKFMCLPCHQCLISDDLVWTEPLFTLFQNILNMNVYLSQDSVDCLVSSVHELADRYPKSLKLGNFLLCLVTKCYTLLKSHKLLLIESVERTNTFMTKSILSKLDGL